MSMSLISKSEIGRNGVLQVCKDLYESVGQFAYW